MEVIRFFELLVVAYKNKGQHNQEERNRALMKVFPHAAPLQTTDRFMIKFLFSSTQTIQPTKPPLPSSRNDVTDTNIFLSAAWSLKIFRHRLSHLTWLPKLLSSPLFYHMPLWTVFFTSFRQPYIRYLLNNSPLLKGLDMAPVGHLSKRAINFSRKCLTQSSDRKEAGKEPKFAFFQEIL